MVTDNAHVIALNRFTGELLWDTELADWRKNYSASSAPLPAGDLRHHRRLGRRAWRQRVRRGARSGNGQGGVALLDRAEAGPAGIRDVAGQGHRARRRADLVHRQLRPGARPRLLADREPEQGVRRRSIARGTTSTPSSMLALDRKTGALKWHYQFTPHDLWDWDATQTSVLIDADWQGQPRRLLLHAEPQRLLLRVRSARRHAAAGEAVRENLTWASGIGADGRPIKLPNQEPSRGHQGLSVAGRRDQLVLAVVQPGDRPLLRADVREVQHLHDQRAGALGERQVVSRRHRRRPPRIPSRSAILKAIDIATGDDQVGTAADRRRATRGAAR